MCDEKLDNTLQDIFRCSSQEVREKKTQEIHQKYSNRSSSLLTNHNPLLTKR